mmetsp:Transcript_87346/g.271342  ORF Transcript_87346/g.271342 Transcript_87346/m.271342 type:complete len:335 (+) Transcript_87346:2139-3143(+)
MAPATGAVALDEHGGQVCAVPSVLPPHVLELNAWDLVHDGANDSLEGDSRRRRDVQVVAVLHDPGRPDALRRRRVQQAVGLLLGLWEGVAIVPADLLAHGEAPNARLVVGIAAEVLPQVVQHVRVGVPRVRVRRLAVPALAAEATSRPRLAPAVPPPVRAMEPLVARATRDVALDDRLARVRQVVLLEDVPSPRNVAGVEQALLVLDGPEAAPLQPSGEVDEAERGLGLPQDAVRDLPKLGDVQRVHGLTLVVVDREPLVYPDLDVELDQVLGLVDELPALVSKGLRSSVVVDVRLLPSPRRRGFAVGLGAQVGEPAAAPDLYGVTAARAAADR